MFTKLLVLNYSHSSKRSYLPVVIFYIAYYVMILQFLMSSPKKKKQILHTQARTLVASVIQYESKGKRKVL